MSQRGKKEGTYTELRDMAKGTEKKPGCCRRHPVCCGTTFLTIGLLAGAAAIALGASYHAIHHKVDVFIQQQVVLKRGAAATDNWANSKAPVYMKYYFFTVTNYKDVEEKGAKPNVQQLGPFTYREYRVKFGMKWEDNGKTVSYKQNTTYVLEPSMSAGNPKTTNVRTINLPLYGVLEMIEALVEDPNRSKLVKELLKALVGVIDFLKMESKWDGLFYEHTVDELLWGYEDVLLKDLKKLTDLIDKNLIPTDRFNLSVKFEMDVGYKVYTGVGDGNLNKVGQYIKWEGRSNISEWGTPTAQMLNGTAGTLFHPGVSTDEKLYVFISELFRSGYITFQRHYTRHGIPLYRFAIPGSELNRTFQDPGFYPGAPSGVLNLTAVSPNNLPFFASKPHFLGGDPQYRVNVTGLHPDAEIHDTTIDIEPLTGEVMGAYKRIQLNILLTRYDSLSELKHIPEDTYLPVYYAAEEGVITKSLADQFKSEVFMARDGIDWGVVAVIIVAGLLFIVCVMLLTGIIVQQRRSSHGRRRTATGRRGRGRVVNTSSDESAPLMPERNKDGEIDI